ncbi:MAG: ThiF family adenylyltransferase [Candidatus Harrisonbacteria bacterium]|nr:ThiF family adenylyltransferase [Candidatus Harrisonbacteria bacterium]
MKPLLFEATEAHRNGTVRFREDGTAELRAAGGPRVIPRTHQYDVTQATIFGLNERLTSSATSPRLPDGTTLRDAFNAEWERYAGALEAAEGFAVNYGVYAYYPERNDLVRYCPEYWHRVVAVASNSTLLSDPEGNRSWSDIRGVFDRANIAIAGCSVGGSIAHAIAMDIRPRQMKLADKSLYKMENVNRVRLAYWDIVQSNAGRGNAMELMLRNKAAATADQLYAIDPFLSVHCYEEGLTEGNVARFFDGGGSEPPATVLIEEVDDPRMKLLLREEARKRRIPLIMATDVGSGVQLDIMRYDRSAATPLANGTGDKALYAAMDAVYANPGDRKTFFAFVDALIGTNYRRGELARIIGGMAEIPTSTIIPQLGSTVAVAGGLVAETVARILLGETYPSRVFFDKHALMVRAED